MATKRNNICVCVPDHIAREVTRAARVRSRVERHPVTQDEIVRRALLEYLWLDEDEMRQGGMTLPASLQAQPPTEAFGSLLRKLRQKARKRVEDLARHLEVPIKHLSDVERGKRVPLTRERIVRAAAFLDTDAAPLLASLARRE